MLKGVLISNPPVPKHCKFIQLSLVSIKWSWKANPLFKHDRKVECMYTRVTEDGKTRTRTFGSKQIKKDTVPKIRCLFFDYYKRLHVRQLISLTSPPPHKGGEAKAKTPTLSRSGHTKDPRKMGTISF